MSYYPEKILQYNPEKILQYKDDTDMIILSQCGLHVVPNDTELSQHWLSDNLLADGTNSIPNPVLINHQRGFVAFTWGQFYMKYSWYEFEND